MSVAKQYPESSGEYATPNWNKLYKISAISALLQLVIVIIYFFVIAVFGGKPDTVEEYLTLLHHDPLAGILRGDIFNLLIVALYLGLFPGVYLALRQVNPIGAAFSTLLTFIAVTLCFASNSDFSMLHLSNQYAIATSEVQKSQLLAAGEAIIAVDMWNSSGAYVSGLFLQGAGVLVSVIMLRNKDFSKVTAVAGILGNGFDLAQHILHPFSPLISETVLMVAGPFYLIWFPMLVRDFSRLYKSGLAQFAK
jgi:hypothetical protein